MIDIIKKYHLFGEYNFKGTKGNQEGNIYFISDNNFVGKVKDNWREYTNFPFLVFGELTPKRLRLEKVPKEDSSSATVSWQLSKIGKNKFKGDFIRRGGKPVYLALEKHLETIINGYGFDLNDFSASEYLDKLEKYDNIFANPSKNGSGIITLTEL